MPDIFLTWCSFRMVATRSFGASVFGTAIAPIFFVRQAGFNFDSSAPNVLLHAHRSRGRSDECRRESKRSRAETYNLASCTLLSFWLFAAVIHVDNQDISILAGCVRLRLLYGSLFLLLLRVWIGALHLFTATPTLYSALYQRRFNSLLSLCVFTCRCPKLHPMPSHFPSSINSEIRALSSGTPSETR